MLRSSASAAIAELSANPLNAGDGSTNHLEESVPLPGELELKDGVFEVGREEPADIVIPVPTVSGRHALLRVSEFLAPSCWQLPCLGAAVYACMVEAV